MKKYLQTLTTAALLASSASAAAQTQASAWSGEGVIPNADRTVAFNTDDKGKSLPIIWGFDTAWNDYANMLRGLRYAGKETVGVARVSFQPWAEITEKGKLPPSLRSNLEARLRNVALAGKKVDIALNLDGGEKTVKEVYGYLDENDNYIGDKEAVADAYAMLIDATAAAVEAAGYNVVSAAPFNEPDFFWNGTPIDVFDLINKRLKNFDEYPRFRDIRISGGNTLNCDQALPWYETLKENLDEGNTHQLAGDFNHYAEFFTRVREDGKHATADELHNVMEAMVGVEYGMQTGIWWGTAEQARGEFCKASSGERLGYAENRQAWSAASVYRNPNGKIQGFAGCSERQARPSTFKFVSANGPVFINGQGPLREYVLSLPGDPDGAYQTNLQRNAETMVNIENGEDVQPFVSGSYAIVSALPSHPVIGGKGGSTSNGNDVVAQAYTHGFWQHWTINPIPNDTGGDFSYYFIRNTTDNQALDDNNWNIETGGKVITYGPSANGVQQWALEYDGDGWFHIRNKHSALYLDAQSGAEGTQIVQNERSDNPSQLWRLLPEGATLEFTAPAAPKALKATSDFTSVSLTWEAGNTADNALFSVLRAGDDGKFKTIARGLETATFHDNSVEGSEVYTYKIMAIDRSGNRSLCSEEVEAGALEGEALIAEYPLEENLDDATGNGFALRKLVEPIFRTRHGEGTKSLYLRNNQALQLPYSLLQRDRFSLALWVYPTSQTSALRVFSTGTDADHCFYLANNDAGELKLVARNGDNTAAISTKALPLQEWAHIAVTVDGTKATLYVNGEPTADSPADLGEAMPPHRTLSYLARSHTDGSPYFTGYMDHLYVYNHPITAEQVLLAMNNEGSGVEGVTVDNAEVTAVEYYNLQGARIANPAPGTVIIEHKVYSDGTTKATKIRL